MVENIRSQGVTTLRRIASELNDHPMLTWRAGDWRLSNVKNLLARLESN